MAAFDTVVISGRVRFLACEADAEYAKTVPVPRWRTAVVIPAIRFCLPAVWVSVKSSKKFPAPKRSEGGDPSGALYYRELL